MHESDAILIDYVVKGKDEYGNPNVVKRETPVYVSPRGVYESEFYDAGKLKLKPEVTLTIENREDYDGQPYVEWQGVEYDVIRVDWNAQRDRVSLVCGRRTK